MKTCTICENEIEDHEVGYEDDLTVICGDCYNTGATDGKE